MIIIIIRVQVFAKVRKMKLFISSISIALFLSACNTTGNKDVESKEDLGELLFNDISLSRDGKQSCASCHDSKRAFIDPRINTTSTDANTPGAVSIGQDELSLGDINTPSATYTGFVPAFHFDNKEKLFKGGLFLNGRATDLVEQAKQPFLNPVEMQTTKNAVVAKVKHKYRQSMQTLYGTNVFKDVDTAFDAVADSIAAFERTEKFASFDSKFDKVLNDEATLTAEEALGRDLFVAEDKGNCAACHPVFKKDSNKVDKLLTDFSYDNLGVPKNTLVRTQNGKGMSFVDTGLFENPAVNDVSLKGAFRVSSLRNVAVTAPYMHNGVFKDLATVVHFYNTRDVVGALNPETNNSWKQAEVDSTKNTDELGDLGLSIAEENAIVAFLKTLTDERYEHLIP